MPDVVACNSATVRTARTLVVWDRPDQLVGIDRQSQVEVRAFGGRFWDVEISRWCPSSSLPVSDWWGNHIHHQSQRGKTYQLDCHRTDQFSSARSGDEEGGSGTYAFLPPVSNG